MDPPKLTNFPASVDPGLHFRKIPTLFVRDFDGLLGPPGKMVTKILHEDSQWVLEGHGYPTRKLDGTCCWISQSRVFYKRLDVKLVWKHGKPIRRNKPANFVLVQEDEKTGHCWGWVPVNPNSSADRWHMDALLYHSKIPEELYLGKNEQKDIATGLKFCTLEPGTYELLGPKVQSHKEKKFVDKLNLDVNEHVLLRHGDNVLEDLPSQLSFENLRAYFETYPDIEGIVWHFPQKDGTIKMAKLKGNDFGLERPAL